MCFLPPSYISNQLVFLRHTQILTACFYSLVWHTFCQGVSHYRFTCVSVWLELSPIRRFIFFCDLCLFAIAGQLTPCSLSSLVWNKNIELEDCLDTFFDVSELSGENKYSCVNCSK